MPVVKKFQFLACFCDNSSRTPQRRLTKVIRTSSSIHHQSFLTRCVQNPGQHDQIIRNPLDFRNPQNHSIKANSPQSRQFLRPNLSIHEPINPPPPGTQNLRVACLQDKLEFKFFFFFFKSTLAHIQYNY